ncbi:MAG: CoA transferase [Acidimicrobiales bacterium]
MRSTAADVAGWAGSGAMALTGPADGPPSVVPAGVASAAAAAASDVAVQTARWGTAVEVDGPALLGERAAITGMGRNGSVSVGGASRFVAAADGWFALSLPRPDDVAALPALVSRDVRPDDWSTIERALGSMTGAEVVAQATLLGLAVGVPGGDPSPVSPGRELARGGPRQPTATPLVLDLTSLWAGPLATSLLMQAGARVIKVEGRNRPDGARRGAPAFFDLLNHGKECVALDFSAPADLRLLRCLVAAADLVVEGSRPRVMDSLGIDPVVTAARGTSWLSITAHGRTGPAADRIGFGDDAAVSAGVVVPGDPPMFVADAVADPLAGLSAAAHGAELLAAGRAAVVEVPLARAAAWAGSRQFAAPLRPAGNGWEVEVDGEFVPVAEPRHRPVPPPAPRHGTHTAAVRAAFVHDDLVPPG